MNTNPDHESICKLHIKRLLRSILALIAILTVSLSAKAAIRYVTPSGAGSMNGSSWTNASNDLQNMINASASGDEIWVAAGTYIPNKTAAGWTTAGPYPTTDGARDNAFVLKIDVKVYGGFAGGETALSQRNVNANATILSGDRGTPGNATDNCYHVVIAARANGTGTSATHLDGFTVRDGNANGTGATITVNTRTIADNYGGGIFSWWGGLNMYNLTVVYNNAISGGGIYTFQTGNNYFVSGKIQANTAGSYGAGVYNSVSTLVIMNSLVTGNKTLPLTGYGTGMGGGIFNYATSTTTARIDLVNTTVAGNVAGRYGGAVANYDYARLNIINSIIWGNFITRSAANANESGANIYNWSASAIMGYGNSILEGLIGNETLVSNWGGNTSADPLFVAPTTAAAAPTTAGDWRVTNYSPAANAGDQTYYTSYFVPQSITTDLDGNARVVESVIDIGPYELAAPFHLLPDANGIVYVDSAHAGCLTCDGSSWTNAYPDLAYPLLKASIDPTIKEIRVAKGHYTPKYQIAASTVSGEKVDTYDRSFVLVKNVKLYGGFASGLPDVTGAAMAASQLAARNFAADETVLSGDINGNDNSVWDVATMPLTPNGNPGAVYPDWNTVLGWAGTRNDNSCHVVVAAGNLGSGCLDGFTVSDGFATEWKVTGELNQPSVRQRLLVNDYFIDRMFGAGIYITYSSPTLNNLIIRDNAQQLGQQSSSIRGYGGGIYMEDPSSPVITNSLITNNVAARGGGGIAIWGGGAPVLDSVEVTSNGAWREGAGIYLCEYPTSSPAYTSLNVHISNSTFKGNRQLQDYNGASSQGASGGSAICWNNPYLSTGSTDPNTGLYIKKTIFDGNKSGAGGAISAYFARYIELDSCQIINNSTVDYPNMRTYGYGIGGAVYLFGANGSANPLVQMGEFVVNNSIVKNNSSITSGGAFQPRLTTLTLYNDSVCNNTAGTDGGAISLPVVNRKSTVNATNVVFTGNTATGNGGALYLNYGMTSATTVTPAGAYINCLIADNTASAANAGTVFYDDGNANTPGPDFVNCTLAGEPAKPIISYVNNNGNTVRFLNSILYANTTGTIGAGTPGSINDFVFQNSLTEQPVGAFGVNASNINNLEDTNPQFNASASGDYTLTATSPAIEAGDNSLFQTARGSAFTSWSTEIDLNNSLRLIDTNIDIGAYEFRALVTLTANDDNATTLINQPVTVDVLGNDVVSGCTPSPVIVTPPLHGSAVVVSDSIRYTPATGFTGNDTITYSITCSGTTATAKVYIVVRDPSLRYGFFVDQHVVGGNHDGTSWENAYITIEEALTKAMPGDFVWVAKGEYNPPTGTAYLMQRDSVEVYGGFGAWEDYLYERDFAENPTIVRGSGVNVITITGTGGRWDGFIVEDGVAADGAGITVNNASPVIANTIIRSNAAQGNGGGIYIANGNPILYNVEISGNTAARGAGMFNANGNPQLTNVTISGNLASSSGGGIANSASAPDIRNTIVWGNRTLTRIDANVANDAASSPRFEYSIVEGSGGSSAWNAIFGTDGTHNRDENPSFIRNGFDLEGNMQQGDYRLRASSAAIDVGRTAFIYNSLTLWNVFLPNPADLSIGNRYLQAVPFDLAFFERIGNDIVDIGAYEFGSEWMDFFITREVIMPEVEGLITDPPTGVYYVLSSHDFTFTVTPQTNYRIDNMKITTGVPLRDSEGMKRTANSDGSLTVTIMSITEPITINFSDVIRSTANENVASDRVWTENDHLCIQTPAASEVKIYTVAGQLVKHQKISEGASRLRLAAGLYIVSLNGVEYKVVVQ